MTTFTVNYWSRNSQEHEDVKVETITESQENTLDVVKQHASEVCESLGWKYAYSVKTDTTAPEGDIMKQWKMVDIDNARYVGTLELENTEDGIFEVVQTEDKLVFGSACNTGLLQSGYLDIDDCFSLDENLQALIEQLESFYDGERDLEIVYNDSM